LDGVPAAVRGVHGDRVALAEAGGLRLHRADLVPTELALLVVQPPPHAPADDDDGRTAAGRLENGPVRDALVLLGPVLRSLVRAGDHVPRFRRGTAGRHRPVGLLRLTGTVLAGPGLLLPAGHGGGEPGDECRVESGAFQGLAARSNALLHSGAVWSTNLCRAQPAPDFVIGRLHGPHGSRPSYDSYDEAEGGRDQEPGHREHALQDRPRLERVAFADAEVLGDHPGPAVVDVRGEDGAR